MSKFEKPDRAGQLRVDIDDRSYSPNGKLPAFDFSVVHVRDGLYSILYKGRSISAVVQQPGTHQLKFTVDDSDYLLNLVDQRLQLLEEYSVSEISGDPERHIVAPMPGLVIKIDANVGDSVAKNDALVVLEAMKMENEIRAPGPGIVAAILVEEGQAVAKNDVLIDLTPESAA